MAARGCHCQQRDQLYEAKRARGEEVKNERNTHSPVGCSYLPVAGVSKVTDTDMLGSESMILLEDELQMCRNQL